MKKRIFLSILAFSSIALSSCYLDLGFIKFGKKPDEQEQGNEQNQENNNNNQQNETAAYDEATQAQRIKEYYSSIDSSASGDTLLTALRTLNLAKRTSVAGYNTMGSVSGKVKFTDYDPATVRFTSDGVPYGTKILSFYSGKVTTNFNREHVWPKSRGGNKVEDDCLMVRPTINEENSDRGNSVYKTGMADDSNGWDPVTAFANNIGVYTSIRGECARIIFYCMTAATGLVLNENTSNNGNNMGVLTDLIEWACENPVNDREKRRNVGSQHVQGNRNAFVDHPEYACKIWGTTNAKTKAACQKANYAVD